MTVIVLPIFMARTLHLLKSTQLGGTHDMKSVFSAFVATEYVCICIPYLWSLYFYLDYLLLPLLIYICFFEKDLNPLYSFVLPYPSLVKVLVQIWSCIGCNILVLTVMMCLLSTINGILVTYLTVNSIISSIGINYVQKIFRVGLGFETGIKIHQILRVLATLQSELARDLIVPCLHHFDTVVLSTISLYYFVLQFLPHGEISLVVVAVSLIMLFGSGVVEFVVVFYIAKATDLSNKFKKKIAFFYGHDKIKRRLIARLQPISINLEFFGSVATIKNGVGMDYFLRYLERVGYHTVSLLLAWK